MSYFLAALMGAAANRVRGGLVALPGGTQVARAVWGAVCGLACLKLGWWSLAVAGSAFVGCMVGQFGGLSMGHRPVAAHQATVFGFLHFPDLFSVSPWVTMTAWGLARVAGPTAVIAYLGGAWWWPLLSGLACAPIYWAVWLLPDWALRVPGLGKGTGPGNGRDPAEMAEALHGAVMLAALV